MNHIRIIPWEEDDTRQEFYIPDYIDNLALDVLKQYSFTVKSMTVVTTKPDKGGAIWKLETNEGPRSLKLLHRRPTRSLFSLGAQEYLVNVQKANVPPIVKTKNGANYVEAGGKCWFVAEWIEPLAPVSKDLEGAKLLCNALGEFHRVSKGYIPPVGAEKPSRLYKWPRSYQKVIDKIDWFRNLANVYQEMPASSVLLKVVDQFEEQARRALHALNQSRYTELIRLGNENWGLVHQDYGWSNGQMGGNGMWIIDLDGVAYDLPIRDLRKLITGTMADLYRWDATWVREMIKAYHEANPITPELYEILMIDLAMPNEFYKNVKEVVYDPELFLIEETLAMIETIVKTDESKWPVLEEVGKDVLNTNSSYTIRNRNEQPRDRKVVMVTGNQLDNYIDRRNDEKEQRKNSEKMDTKKESSKKEKAKEMKKDLNKKKDKKSDKNKEKTKNKEKKEKKQKKDKKEGKKK